MKWVRAFPPRRAPQLSNSISVLSFISCHVCLVSAIREILESKNSLTLADCFLETLVVRPEKVHCFHDGCSQVPNNDNVAVPRDMRATARVDANSLPVDEEARELIVTHHHFQYHPGTLGHRLCLCYYRRVCADA
jgi:hypothetical protein